MEWLKGIRLIQGGMGVYVSNWRLARETAMSSAGVTAGTISSVALEIVYPRLLQLGDPGGHINRAFTAFDELFGTEIGKKFFDRYFIAGGKASDERFRPIPLPILAKADGTREVLPSDGETVQLKLDQELVELYVLTGFAETWLAKQGHRGKIIINFLSKIELSLIFILYGALLAGVDAVAMGAGNPEGMPQMTTRLSSHQQVEYEPSMLYKEVGERFVLTFDPAVVADGRLVRQKIERPAFLAIVSLQDLVLALDGSPTEAPDGYIIENFRAGGHNANPAGPLKLDAAGQPIYGEKDVADLSAIAGTGKPFWCAGGYDSGEKLHEALSAGAAGVQAGTVFALCEESGMRPDHRQAIFAAFKQGKSDADIVKTTMASPTGFAFKVARLPGTLSEHEVYHARRRICDVGVLQKAGLGKPDESGARKIFQRCPAAGVDRFVANRGLERNTEGKACLCNGLLAGAGFPQMVKSADGSLHEEPSIVTLGQELEGARRLSHNGQTVFWVRDVVRDILG